MRKAGVTRSMERRPVKGTGARSLRILADAGEHQVLETGREPVEVDELLALRVRAGAGYGAVARSVLKLVRSAGLQEAIRENREIGVDAVQSPNRGDLLRIETLR